MAVYRAMYIVSPWGLRRERADGEREALWVMGGWEEAVQKVCAKAGLVEGGGRGYTMEPVGGMGDGK